MVRELVSLGEIKELAEVGRPTVSNWRRRHDDFPRPVGGSAGKPLFDAEAVADWLDARLVPGEKPGKDGMPATYGERFRRELRLRRLISLGRGSTSPEALITDALHVLAWLRGSQAGWEGEGVAQLAHSRDARGWMAGEQAGAVDDGIKEASIDLARQLGSAGAAAEAVLGFAGRLESDLVMDMTPPPLAQLIRKLVAARQDGLDQTSLINLYAGTGDLLFALDDLPASWDTIAVEPELSRRKLLTYRWLAHWKAGPDVRAALGEAADLPAADIVLADPPYVPGEREREEDGPLARVLEAARLLKPGGSGYVVVPSWTLSRPRGSAATPTVRAREELLGRHEVEAVVQLPRRIHQFRTGAEHALLVLRRDPGPEDRERVLLVDADRIARRVGDDWPAYVAEVLRSGHSPVAEEAGYAPVVAAGPRTDALLDGRSVLPAHRLASPEKGLDHFEASLDARREVSVAVPHLREWVGKLGVARRSASAQVAHRKVDEHLRAGQLRLLPGHRIRESDIGEAGLMVIGREEMLGALPLGRRRIALEDLAQYPQALTTERGDVFLLTEHGVRTQVDDAGGCVLLAPVQGLRISAYRKHLEALAKGEPVRPEDLWIRPQPLARLIAAPRNQQRGSGSLVRRISLRDMDLPQLPPEEIAELEAVLTETERQRAEVRRQLAALDALAERLAAGVADGELALRRRPDRA